MLTENDFSDAQQALIDALYGGNILAIAPMGMGKTAAAQTAATELIKDGHLKRVLVIAPLKVAQLTWANEHTKWSHLEAPAMAIGDVAKRKEALESDNPLVVINMDNVPWLMKSNDLVALGFDGLVIDEISKFKSPGSSRVRALRPRLKNFKWRVGLSAAPLTESGMEIYSQALLIDMGKSLGRSFDAFKRKFFIPTDYLQYDWVFMPPDGQQRLAAALKPIVYIAESESYTTALPILRDHIHTIKLPKHARAAYSAMARDMVAEVSDNAIEAPSNAVLSLKLLQIASGWVYNSESEAIQIHSEKIDWVKNFVKPGQRIILSYWFKYELAALREAFPGLTVLSDDPVAAMAAWNAEDIDLLALHPAAGGHGTNLQKSCHTLICLGPFWSLDLWGQLLGRILRRGSTAKYVDRHVLIAESTVDELVMSRLEGKKMREGILMDHIRNAAENQPTE